MGVGLNAGLRAACWPWSGADVWLQGPLHQWLFGTGDLSAIHPIALQPILPRVPGHSPRQSWLFGIATNLQHPTSEPKRSVSKKVRPLGLFKYFSVRESFICFKELMAVVSDFHCKDILKLSKEIWNEFAVLHPSKCYSHWPSKEKHCQIIIGIFAFKGTNVISKKHSILGT